MSEHVNKPVDTVENAVIYLRGRVTHVFDSGGRAARWSLIDARAVRVVLDALAKASK